jgi:hypothetical protein
MKMEKADHLFWKSNALEVWSMKKSASLLVDLKSTKDTEKAHYLGFQIYNEKKTKFVFL